MFWDALEDFGRLWQPLRDFVRLWMLWKVLEALRVFGNKRGSKQLEKHFWCCGGSSSSKSKHDGHPLFIVLSVILSQKMCFLWPHEQQK